MSHAKQKVVTLSQFIDPLLATDKRKKLMQQRETKTREETEHQNVVPFAAFTAEERIDKDSLGIKLYFAFTVERSGA